MDGRAGRHASPVAIELVRSHQQRVFIRSAELLHGLHDDAVHVRRIDAGAGAAVIITSPAGVKYRYATHLSFALESDRCTNNIAEYEAVILGLRNLGALDVTTCIIRTDSKVVADQIKKEYENWRPGAAQPHNLKVK